MYTVKVDSHGLRLTALHMSDHVPFYRRKFTQGLDFCSTFFGIVLPQVKRTCLDRGTRIDLALDVAAGILAGQSSRPQNNKVLVLLTDGRPDQGSEGLMLEAAGRAGSGREVYVVGLGDEVGADLMRQVASRPENYLAAPGPEELRAVYEAVAGQLPCPGGVLWGGF